MNTVVYKLYIALYREHRTVYITYIKTKIVFISNINTLYFNIVCHCIVIELYTVNIALNVLLIVVHFEHK